MRVGIFVLFFLCLKSEFSLAHEQGTALDMFAGMSALAQECERVQPKLKNAEAKMVAGLRPDERAMWEQARKDPRFQSIVLDTRRILAKKSKKDLLQECGTVDSWSKR